MKKLILSIITVFLIWTVSSAQNIQDTTKKKIELPEKVAKEVVKDLLRNDSLSSELELTKQYLNFEKDKSNAKDSLIFNLNQQIGVYKLKENNYKNIFNEKDIQINLYKQTNDKLLKDLKKEKHKRIFFGILKDAAIGILGLKVVGVIK